MNPTELVSDFTAAGFALAASMSNKAPTALPKAPDRALELSLRNGSPAAFADPYQDVKTKIIQTNFICQFTRRIGISFLWDSFTHHNNAEAPCLNIV